MDRRSKNLIIVFVFFMAMFLIVIGGFSSMAHADDGVAISYKDGDQIIQTLDGNTYIGKEFDVADNMAILKQVRYPSGIAELAIPIHLIKIIFSVDIKQ